MRPEDAKNLQMVQKSEEKLFSLLVSGIKEYAVFMINPDGFIITWNKGATLIYGYIENEIIARHVSVFYSQKSGNENEHPDNFQKALATGSFEKEARCIRKDGSMFWANIVISAVFDDAGLLLGYAIIVREISNKKKQREEDAQESAGPDGDLAGNLPNNNNNALLTKAISDKIPAEEQAEESMMESIGAAEIQSAILNALAPNIAMLNEDGIIVSVNDSWKKFAELNGLKIQDYGIGFNYVAISAAAIGVDEAGSLEIAEGILCVLSGKLAEFIMEYPCELPAQKGWFRVIVAPIASQNRKGAVVAQINITGRKLAEERLLASEQRYRNIVETAQEGIWMIGKDLRTIFANKKMGDLLGYTPQEMIGKHNYEFKHEEDKTETLARIEENLHTGRTETHESRYITKDKREIICSVTTSIVYDYDGSHYGALAMVTDITERKEHEQNLKRSEANLSAIIENTTDMVYSLDANLNFITYNQIFKKTVKAVYGFNIEEGGNALELLVNYNTEVADKWKQNYERALAGETLNFVNEYKYGNDSVYLSYSINPINSGGQVIGLSCFSRDITQQRRDELILLRSEANMRSVFENTDLGIALLDDKLNVVSYNSNASKQSASLIGKTIVSGSPVMDYFPEDSWPIVNGIIQKVKLGEAVDYETVYENSEGEQHWFDMHWVGIFNTANENIGIIVTQKNITDKKNADLEREKMTLELTKRNRDLEQFTYIISHNLRAPIANIMGLSAILDSFDYTDPECMETVGTLAIAVNNLDKVILDLNTILETGNQVSERKELVLLPLLVEEIKDTIKSLIDKSGTSILYNFDEALEIDTIKSYLYSIFQNLIVNAIKYCKNEMNPQISIKTHRNNNKVYISFSDNGRGIDLEKYGDHLFGLYKRFDFSVQGRGMGLYMVKMQAEALGGHISVNSELGNGTEFVLELPV